MYLEPRFYEYSRSKRRIIIYTGWTIRNFAAKCTWSYIIILNTARIQSVQNLLPHPVKRGEMRFMHTLLRLLLLPHSFFPAAQPLDRMLKFVLLLPSETLKSSGDWIRIVVGAKAVVYRSEGGIIIYPVPAPATAEIRNHHSVGLSWF